MKIVFATLVLSLATTSALAANLNKEAKIPTGQICEMVWDTFDWIQPDPSVSEYSLNCLNSEVLKIYTYDEGVLKFRESISKKSLRASFYEVAEKKLIYVEPVTLKTKTMKY